MPLTNCDGQEILFCATGTCYTGYDGFIGCCTTTGCAARTTCLTYDASSTSSCNMDYGGCVACNAKNPSCVTISNALEDQYGMYCAPTGTFVLTSYQNLVTTGSMAQPPSTSAPATSSSSNPTAAASSTTSSPPSSITSMTAPPFPITPNSQSTTSASNAQNQNQNSDTRTTSIAPGTIVGIVIGGIVGTALLMLLALFFIRLCKRRRRNRHTLGPPPGHPSYNSRSFHEKDSFHESPDVLLGLGIRRENKSATVDGSFSPLASPASNGTALSPDTVHRTYITRPLSTLSVVNGMSPELPDTSTISALSPRSPPLSNITEEPASVRSSSNTQHELEGFRPYRPGSISPPPGSGNESRQGPHRSVSMATATGFGSGYGGRTRGYVTPEHAFIYGLGSDEDDVEGEAGSSQTDYAAMLASGRRPVD